MLDLHGQSEQSTLIIILLFALEQAQNNTRFKLMS